MADPSVQPIFDPLEALFLMPPGRRARHVWVDGAQAVADFSPTSALPDDPAGEIETIFQKLLDSFEDRNWRGMASNAIHVPSRTSRRKNDLKSERNLPPC